MEAITREEKIISGENLTPITRKEMFLAKASGQNIQTPTPITREEIFLSKITGGGGSVEGTAIPVGVAPQRVYFNLNNTIEQTNAYLSQLTYVQTDLFEHPICGICGYLLGENPILMFAVKTFDISTGGNAYLIYRSRGMTFTKIFNGVNSEGLFDIKNGFRVIDNDPFGDYSYSMQFTPQYEVTDLTDFMGLPLGLENEKIKNVLSITPFGASCEDGDSGELQINDTTPDKNLPISTLYNVNLNLKFAQDIKADAFSEWSGLLSVKLPNVTSIGEYAFMNCTFLSSVDSPRLTSIGDNAFDGCTMLKSIDLSKVTSIGNHAFSDCIEFTTINLPKATSISGGAFYGCFRLDTLILSNTETVCNFAVDAITNTKILTAENMPTGEGFVYVPTALYEQYVAALVAQVMQAGYDEATATYLITAVLRKIEDYPEICGVA